MKAMRKLLAACVLLAGIGVVGGAQAADSPAATPAPQSAIAQAALEKDAVCTRCHDESETAPVLSIYQTKHGVRADGRSPTCQSCHGASEKHLKGDPNVKGRAAPDVVFKKGAYGVSDDRERAAQCLNCHTTSKRNGWEGGPHQANGLACNDCHKVHQPVDKVVSKLTQPAVCFTCHKEQRADIHKVSTHPISVGKVTCSDCHNPHGSAAPKSLTKSTVNETCFQCHAEKRGPFLFEHQPVAEDCSNCHTPHGSNIFPLLKSRPPFMCQECHDGTHASATQAGPAVAGKQIGLTGAPSGNLTGRACTNCHSQVHGSNSPGGGYLQR